MGSNHKAIFDESVKDALSDFLLEHTNYQGDHKTLKAEQNAYYFKRFSYQLEQNVEQLNASVESFLTLLRNNNKLFETYLPNLFWALQNKSNESNAVQRLKVVISTIYLNDYGNSSNSEIKLYMQKFIEENAKYCTEEELFYIKSILKDSEYIETQVSIIKAFPNEDDRYYYYYRLLYYLGSKGEIKKVTDLCDYVDEICQSNPNSKCLPYAAKAYCSWMNKDYMVAEGEFEKALDTFSDPYHITPYQASVILNYSYMYADIAENLELRTNKRTNKRTEFLEKAKALMNRWITSNLDNEYKILFISERSYLNSELGLIDAAYNDYREAKTISENGLTLKNTNISTHMWVMSKYLDLHNENKGEEIIDDFWEFYSSYPNRMYTYKPLFDFLSSDTYLNEHKDIKMRFTRSLISAVFHAQEIQTEAKIRDYSGYKILFYTKMRSLKMLLEDEASKGNNQTEYSFRLPLFSSRHMNDPAEGITLQKFLSKKLGNKNKFLIEQKSKGIGGREIFNEHYMFIKSFFIQKRKEGDTIFDAQEFLPMWVQYGDDAQGCCVVLSNKTFEKSNNSGAADSGRINTGEHGEIKYSLRKVIYIGDKIDNLDSSMKKAILKLVSSLKNIAKLCDEIQLNKSDESTSEGKCFLGIKNQVSYILSLVTYLFKTDAYKHEQEARLLVARSSNNLNDVLKLDQEVPKLYLYPNMQTYIDEVILGPKLTSDEDFVPFIQMQGGKMWKDDSDQRRINVTRSTLNYR